MNTNSSVRCFRYVQSVRKKGAIFPTLSPYILNLKALLLMEATGIDKYITFHCFRDTLAMRNGKCLLHQVFTLRFAK